ncbi:4-aminobutyrate aminotransferase apoenzyme [Parapedobacter luteus]|uniref:4-aminobutyrate aminotransferase apoenzyme n=1 Tax=Parapedobacter luteus TaxID=623280 RepID=A0A1T5A055_9SPHI|nr:aspartate aminotransferase family protein [Parapedobacter luteus]SKB28157.1 4-aminobutyrate aminotransferase apoenzyme [Parapedobacter luteus]
MTSVNPHSRAEGDVNNTEFRKYWDNTHNNETASVLSRDAKAFLHQSLSTPCLDVLASSDGALVTNLQGKTYIDFHGNNVHQLGYHNPYVIERVKRQLDTLAFCPRRFTNLPTIELAERLSALTGGQLTRVLFAPGGTSAIGMALKLARIATGNYKTISMYDSFHGASMDSISVGGEYIFHQGLGPLLVGSVHVPPVDHYRGMWHMADQPSGDMAYADYIEYVIEKEGDIGAILAETVRSTTVHVPSEGYWKRIREICDKHQILLILDEIPTALGRTGNTFVYEHYGIVPDIVVLGKGLGAGVVPMAAILCKESLNVAAHVSLGHFTHEKNPLGAAAALAALDYMDEYRVLEHVNTLSTIVNQRLKAMKASYREVGDVRGIGLLWGIELVQDNDSKTPHPVLAEQVLYRCLEKGMSLKVSGGNVLSLYPPLVIDEQQLGEALDVLEEAIQESIQS